MKNPYEVLGVPRDADDKRIKDEYRKLARKHHPDVNPGDKAAEDRFKDIQVAYDVLSDPTKRKQYDHGGAAAFEGGFGGRPDGRAGGGFGFPSFEDIFGQGSLNEILSSLFGGAARPQEPRRGDDIQATIDVSLEDALQGGERELAIPIGSPCATCGGTGADPKDLPEPCAACHGSGQQTMRRGTLRVGTACTQCGGKGRRPPKPCPTCSGSGVGPEVRKVKVRLPKGVEDGVLLRVPRKGMSSPAGAGDLFLRVHYVQDPRFERRGKDLHAEVLVSLAEAALGGEVTVVTPDGPVRIRVPQGTPSGRKIRLNEKGIPSSKGKRGDLYLDVRIIPPPAPNDEERAILEQFAKTSTFNPREL